MADSLSIDSSSMNTQNIPVIIGIGASAGGLEALEQFFAPIPIDCGVGFVVVQHLDPNHSCILAELLQRITALKVSVASEGVRVKSGCIYVIPPNKDLSILHGKLHLLETVNAKGGHLPIDFFFKALADDLRERAIGVVLSGMGSDGTKGLLAIKENAGLAVAQTPESAKFDAMPRSAIATRLIDIIQPPPVMWEIISFYINHQRTHNQPNLDTFLNTTSQTALEHIIILLRERTGNNFSMYKKNTICRRIERRIGANRLEHLDQYVRYLRENTVELDLLFKELLIGVTHFFRDHSTWEKLKTSILPALLATYPNGKELRAWVSACSTGEEAYSLAIVFQEVITQTALLHRFKLQVFATDLDPEAIEQARLGIYKPAIENDVSPERLARFFVAHPQGYQISKEIREMVIFARQNIIMDPPFTKLDILSCRNMLIYFGTDLQRKLIALFHYALLNHGILMLGNSETINNLNTLFNVVDFSSRIYERIDAPILSENLDFPTKYFPITPSPSPMPIPQLKTSVNFQQHIDQLLLQSYAPAAVVINAQGDILYINGRTGKYLEPASGKANWNIHAMARDGLRYELSHAIKKIQQQTNIIYLHDLSLATNTEICRVNITIQLITKPEDLNGLIIIVFYDVVKPITRKRTVKKPTAEQQMLLDELDKAHNEIQTLREEMQTSQEELKSSNEELQSTNEELQSTNEELTTSKEEMQSLNEELQTVNAELQGKVTDLSWVNNDMENLLNSMEIATIFLDSALNVRRFTRHSVHLFKLIASDLGRPLSDIVTDLVYPQLQDDALSVLRTLVFIEKETQTKDARWFTVRIMPYRTHDNVIDGVVITFIDITKIKLLEIQLRTDSV
ncbi:MAG: PAS domain-containing protein [Methylovulum sp.]|nr:PAS domain-containing protein [Methylovulum sp.]MCF7997628.1 PAS domain-containing protein [Methylovulum sp.]